MAVAEIQFPSKALGRRVTYTAILPEGEAFGQAPFSLVYMLHGKSDDHRAWLYYSKLEAYVRHRPWVVVMPDGAISFWQNISPTERYQDFVMEDLDDHVRRMFPIRPGKAAIGGLSMGGYGALRFALLFPERFCSVWAHSSAVLRGEDLQKRHGVPEQNGDLYELAERADPDNLPVLGLDCGTDDGLIGCNREFHEHLDRLGIPHTYKEHPGAHSWEYWDTHVHSGLAQHHKVFAEETK